MTNTGYISVQLWVLVASNKPPEPPKPTRNHPKAHPRRSQSALLSFSIFVWIITWLLGAHERPQKTPQSGPGEPERSNKTPQPRIFSIFIFSRLLFSSLPLSSPFIPLYAALALSPSVSLSLSPSPSHIVAPNWQCVVPQRKAE